MSLPFPFSEATCPACGGTGELSDEDCPRCDGTGWLDGFVPDDAFLMVCPECVGPGTVLSQHAYVHGKTIGTRTVTRDCRACDGTGWLLLAPPP